MKPSRNDWFYRRSAFPLRDAMPFALEQFWNNQLKFPRASDIEWQSAGPANVAGRVTCLVRDIDEDQTLFAGTAAGGVWKSSDGGLSWALAWPRYLSQNIGALAIDPVHPGHIVCATGDGNLSANTYPGSGIFTTNDCGRTWTPWVSPHTGKPLDSQGNNRIPRRIASMSVAVSSRGSSLFAFGAVTKDESLPAGLFFDTDVHTHGHDHVHEGERFITRWGTRSYNCHSVVFHPKRASTLYAAIEPRGTQNGIWRTTDRGRTWKHLNPGGLPAGERCGRISIAISSADPNVLYALVGSPDGALLGVFRSNNGGDSWTKTGAGSLSREGNLSNNSVIAIHPGDPDLVIFGATHLHLSRNGGAKWENISVGKVNPGHHAILLSGSVRKPVIYSANDGGVAASLDGGQSWQNRSRGMVTTMFYNIGVAPNDSNVFGGGAQDLGALLHSRESSPSFSRPFKGDGGLLVFDPVDPKVIFGANADGRVFRHDSQAAFSKGWKASNPPLSTAEKKLRSLYLLAIRPAQGSRPQQRWLATSRLWFSPREGKAFRPASRYLDNSAISALAFSPVDPNVIIAATSEGGIFRIGFIEDVWFWSPNLAGPIIPNRLITQLRFHPTDPKTLILSVGSTNTPAANLKGDISPFSHIFRSRDQGNTWEDIDGGALPNVVYNALAYETHHPFRIFAGGDTGVWMYDEKRWVNITGNLPNVIISDLDYHAKDRILTAATFGRGIWRLPLPTGRKFNLEPSHTDFQEPVPPPFAGHLVEPASPIPDPRPPKNGELNWTAVPDAVRYVVQFTATKEHGSVTGILSSTEPHIPIPDQFGDAFHWRVWALLPDGRRSGPSARRLTKIRRS